MSLKSKYLTKTTAITTIITTDAIIGVLAVILCILPLQIVDGNLDNSAANKKNNIAPLLYYSSSKIRSENNIYDNVHRILRDEAAVYRNENVRWRKMPIDREQMDRRSKRQTKTTANNKVKKINISNSTSRSSSSSSSSNSYKNSTKTINFSNRNIDTINISDLVVDLTPNEFSDICVLNFSNNKFVHLLNTTIKQIDNIFHNLQQLDLSNNLLQSFDIDTSVKFVQLKFLNLSNNQLNVFNINRQNHTNVNTKQMLNLYAIDLSCNRISEPEQINFSGTISDHLELIDLSGNALRQLHRSVFETTRQLKTLNLACNRMTKLLKNYFFNLELIETLVLSHNAITTIENDTFVYLPNLQYLDLSYNDIDSQSIRALQGIPDLVRLSVAHNPRLGNALQGFVASWSLKELDVSGTGLCQIPSALAQSVHTLRIANNYLQMIRCGDLDSYPLLQLLDLSSNHIEYIEDDALGRLEILTTVFLNNNSLTNIPTSLPSSLIHLQLQHNQITDIQPSSINQLISLETLNLAGNRLTYLPGLPLPKLITLNLRAAQLRGLSQSVAQQSPNLRELLLENNPIKCTELLGIAEWASPCRSENLFEFIQIHKTTIIPDINDNHHRLTNQFIHDGRCCGKNVNDRKLFNGKQSVLPPLCFIKEKLINSSNQLAALESEKILTATVMGDTMVLPVVITTKTTTTTYNSNDLWQQFDIDNDDEKKVLQTNKIDYGNNTTATMSQSGQSATAVTDTNISNSYKLGDNNENNNNNSTGIVNKSLGKYNGSVNLDDNDAAAAAVVGGAYSSIAHSYNDDIDGGVVYNNNNDDDDDDDDDGDGVVHEIVTHNDKTKGFKKQQLKINAKDKLLAVAIANTTSNKNDNDDANILIVDETMLSTTMKLRKENITTTSTTTTIAAESGNKKRWKNIAKTSNKIRPTAIASTIKENKEVLPILQKFFSNNTIGSKAIKSQPTASNLHTTAINQTTITKATTTTTASSIQTDNKNSLKGGKTTLHNVENKFNVGGDGGGMAKILPNIEWENDNKNRLTTNFTSSTKRQIVVHHKKLNKLKQQVNDKLPQRPQTLISMPSTTTAIPTHNTAENDEDDKEAYLGDEGKPLAMLPQKLATIQTNKKNDNDNINVTNNDDDDDDNDDGNHQHNDKLDNLADSLAKMMTRQKSYNILTRTGLQNTKEQRMDNVTPQQSKHLSLPPIYEKQQEHHQQQQQQQQQQQLKNNINGNSKKEIINWNTNNPISQQLQDNETTNIKQVTGVASAMGSTTINDANKLVQSEHLLVDQTYKYRQQSNENVQSLPTLIKYNQSNRNEMVKEQRYIQNNVNDLNLNETTNNNWQPLHNHHTASTTTSETNNNNNNRRIEAALKLNNHYDNINLHRKKFSLKTINQDNIEVFPVLAKSLNTNHSQSFNNTFVHLNKTKVIAAVAKSSILTNGNNNNNSNNNKNAQKKMLTINSHNNYPEGNVNNDDEDVSGGGNSAGDGNDNYIHNQQQNENGNNGKCKSSTGKCENNIYAISGVENLLNTKLQLPSTSNINHAIKENVSPNAPSSLSLPLPSSLSSSKPYSDEVSNYNRHHSIETTTKTVTILQHNQTKENLIGNGENNNNNNNTTTSSSSSSSSSSVSSSTNGVPEQWNDIRDSTGHPGLFIVIGVTIGMIASLALIHLYRCRKPWSPNRSRKLHDDDHEQYTPAHHDLLPMDILDVSTTNNIATTRGNCSTIHYTDTPIDLW